MSPERQIHGWFLSVCAVAIMGASLWLALARGFWPAWLLVFVNLGLAAFVTGSIISARKAKP